MEKKSGKSYFDKSRRAYICERQISNKNQALKHLEVSDDTAIRIEIQSLIITEIQDGNSKEFIKEKLLKDKRYKKYESFFDTWIEDKMKPRRVKTDKNRFEK